MENQEEADIEEDGVNAKNHQDQAEGHDPEDGEKDVEWKTLSCGDAKIISSIKFKLCLPSLLHLSSKLRSV